MYSKNNNLFKRLYVVLRTKNWKRSYSYKVKDYKKNQVYSENENCRRVKRVKINQ